MPPIFDLFSKRQKRSRGEVPDVYTYDEIPRPLRVQITHIWSDAFGSATGYSKSEESYEFIHGALCREYGVYSLTDNPNRRLYSGRVADFLLSTEETDQVLDVIELSFQVIDGEFVRGHAYQAVSSTQITPDHAIQELNDRLREHGVGYQFESGELVRVDSQLIHAEVVKPVLVLLNEQIYKGANEEFLKAHEHYRHQRYKECINECLKAFESTMKIICGKRGWTFKPTDTASALIGVCFTNGLIPSYLQSQFGALKSVLESGVPSVRNKQAHGQGSQPTEAPEYLASYLLHLTASNILLLINAEKALPH